jgi:multiple sugar transport system ATP-binding protein
LAIHPDAMARYRSLSEYLGREVVAGIRPGDFEDSRVAAASSNGNTLDAEVDVVEALGAESFVHFTIDVPPVITPDIEELLADTEAEPASLGDSSRFTARVSADVVVEDGDRITLAADTSKVHLFDPATGDRLT